MWLTIARFFCARVHVYVICNTVLSIIVSGVADKPKNSTLRRQVLALRGAIHL